MWAENKRLCTWGSSPRKPATASSRIFVSPRAFITSFPWWTWCWTGDGEAIERCLTWWWRKRRWNKGHVGVRGYVGVGLNQEPILTKSIIMLNKIRKRRKNKEKLKRRGGGGGRRGKQRNWRNIGKNRSKKPWHYPSWNNWKTCQTENLHEIMQTSISKAFRCLYFHLWLVLNP